MYIVQMQNGGATPVEIQNEHVKLFTGSVVKGINAIDSFTFSVLPDNPAFGQLKNFTTLVNVYNLAQQRYDFKGRVLYTVPQMNDKGLLTQEVICESYLGFLCDSQQEYVEVKEDKAWTPKEMLTHILNCHNEQMEEYKHFKVGVVDMTDPDGLLVGKPIQREKTWDSIKKNLLDVLGGEIRYREADDGMYIDYAKKFGDVKTTEIALSKNMKSIIKEKNPSAFITRLIPLGAKKSDSSEERYGIAEVNGGKNYIDDEQAIAEYGLHVGYVEFDEETSPAKIKELGEAWLEDNNKVSIKYTITALDLSLIGLDIDDFDVCNIYPVKNALLGIDDLARINKKTIDVCDDTKTSIEIGESFKSLSELQREQMVSLNKLNGNVALIIRNYVTNKKLADEINKTVSLIEQTEKDIKLHVSQTYATQGSIKNEVSAQVKLGLDNLDLSSYIDLSVYAKDEDLQEAKAQIALAVKTNDKGELQSSVKIGANKLEIETDNFTLDGEGNIEANAGKIGGWKLHGGFLKDEYIQGQATYTLADGTTKYQTTRLTPRGIYVWTSTEEYPDPTDMWGYTYGTTWSAMFDVINNDLNDWS